MVFFCRVSICKGFYDQVSTGQPTCAGIVVRSAIPTSLSRELNELFRSPVLRQAQVDPPWDELVALIELHYPKAGGGVSLIACCGRGAPVRAENQGYALVFQ